MGVIRLDSEKTSCLCLFNKDSQRASSEPTTGLTERSLPKCRPAPSEGGGSSCWSLHLESTSTHPLLAWCLALSSSHGSLLEGSVP